MNSPAPLLFCAALLLGLPHLAPADEETPPPLVPAKSSSSTLVSPGGFVAHSLRFLNPDGDSEGRVFIEKDGLVTATLEGVRAVSFSPVDDILLLREDLADDDLRHYLLNIGTGQFTRTEPRQQYVFGSRFVSRAEWSRDGKFLVLFDHPGITGAPPEVIAVADHLTAAPPKAPTP